MDRTGQIVRLRSDAVPTRFKTFPEYLKRVSITSMSITSDYIMNNSDKTD